MRKHMKEGNTVNEIECTKKTHLYKTTNLSTRLDVT